MRATQPRRARDVTGAPAPALSIDTLGGVRRVRVSQYVPDHSAAKLFGNVQCYIIGCLRNVLGM